MPEPSSASRCPCFPDWVLLDAIGHVAPLENATTAGTTTSTLSPIEVSFEVVDPPGLTRCVVNCPELKADYESMPPMVIGSDGAFLLICVGFPSRKDRGMHTDFFVYKAGPGTPSLHLLPRPYPASLYSKHVGVLSCGDGHCLLVVPGRPTKDDDHDRMRYDLQVFSTETKSWTTRAARVASDLEGYSGLLLQHQPTKAFSVGGDSLAWVDTYLGVLLCDVLGKDPEMRLIDLPPVMPTNKVHLGGGFVAPTHSLSAARDVICKDGWITCVETEFPELSSINPMEFRWTAIISKRRMFSSDRWEIFTVDSARISPTGSCFPDLFPGIWDSNCRLTLNNVISTSPILDAFHDNVVFMKSKLDPRYPNGWILAVDTRYKKLLRVVPFSARKLYIDHGYRQCDFSKYLGKALDKRLTIVSTENISREVRLSLVSCVFATLMSQQQFRQFEESLRQKRSCYVEARSLLHSVAGSTLYANIQELARYATSNGLGEAATDAVTVFLGVYQELDIMLSQDLSNDPSACDETMREKICIAIGALDSLLQTVPSQVLRAGRSALAVACMDECVGEEGIAEKLASQHLSHVF